MRHVDHHNIIFSNGKQPKLGTGYMNGVNRATRMNRVNNASKQPTKRSAISMHCAMNGAKEALIYSVQLLSSPGIMSGLAELAREMNLINQERILKYADPQRHRSTPKVNWSITHATNWAKIFCVFQKSNPFFFSNLPISVRWQQRQC